jgi:hypothetical protein
MGTRFAGVIKGGIRKSIPVIVLASTTQKGKALKWILLSSVTTLVQRSAGV